MDNNNNSNSNTILKPIKCYRRNVINEPTAEVCYNCSLILVCIKESKKEDESRKEKEKEDKVKLLEHDVRELKMIIEELAKRLKSNK